MYDHKTFREIIAWKTHTNLHNASKAMLRYIQQNAAAAHSFLVNKNISNTLKSNITSITLHTFHFFQLTAFTMTSSSSCEAVTLATRRWRRPADVSADLNIVRMDRYVTVITKQLRYRNYSFPTCRYRSRQRSPVRYIGLCVLILHPLIISDEVVTIMLLFLYVICLYGFLHFSMPAKKEKQYH